ncbi:DUF6880 family protein [Phyllobacterium sp. SB3]|uniref:DUF6880 family protein n=1 Tax=Phyllobacterium sp. SB3 TaxID=3156073 RepID=UPI0032B0161B
MASKTTLNAKNLEALGTERLAALLIEISTGSATSKRRLRIELAGLQSNDEVIREVTKRLAAIDRSRSKIGWRQVRTLKKDLETQWRTITEIIAPNDPNEALEVMWRFMDIAGSVLARTNDTNGTLLSVFSSACTDFGAIALKATPDPTVLAKRAFSALHNNEYGQYDGLIAALAAPLQQQGMDQLKALLIANLKTLKIAFADNSRRVSYADGLEQRKQESEIRKFLRQIADAQGDVDAFIETHDDDGSRPLIAVEIASRLLATGRSREALDSLKRASQATSEPMPYEWQAIYADTLEKLDRKDEAQSLRWQWFEQSFHEEHLRAFLKRLPDFDDMEAEEKALSHVAAYPDAHQALRFLLTWPHLEKAARLVISRETDLSGDDYELLSLAADTLRNSFPVAATIALRKMIDFTLGWSRAARYRHAARQLNELETISANITDYGSIETHHAYAAKLKTRYQTKSKFWKMRRP